MLTSFSLPTAYSLGYKHSKTTLVLETNKGPLVTPLPL